MELDVNLNRNLNILLNNCISDKCTIHPKNYFFTLRRNEISYFTPLSLYPNLVIFGQDVRNLECREALDIHIQGMITKLLLS
jgi:hypothetical protein